MSFEQEHGKEEFTFAELDKILHDALEELSASERNTKKALFMDSMKKFAKPGYSDHYRISGKEMKRHTNEMKQSRNNPITSGNIDHIMNGLHNFKRDEH